MTKNKRIKLIFILSLIIIIFNVLLINITYKIDKKGLSKETSTDITRIDTITEIEMDYPLGSLLGIDHKYIKPNEALIVKQIDLASNVSKLDIINTTDYKVDLNALLNRTYVTSKIIGEDPIVLIIHTHGTESFVPNNKNYYFTDTSFNSTDITQNIVAVGDEFCNVLEKNNIPFIHDKTMFDENSYKLSYKNSGIAVEEYIKKYPSIRYIIDIHRDTICDKDNVNQKPITIIDGKRTAQIMFVVGTNAGGANHPNWKDNLTIVLKYQAIINEKYPSLARPIYLHTSSFNQFNMPTMMLLEIGASGNTLEEAKNAAILSAECFVELLNKY